jgi:hypothetical protein
MSKARDVKITKKFVNSVEEQKKTFDKLVDNLPEPPKPVIHANEQKEESSEGFIIDDPQLQKIGDSGKTTLRKFADVNLASRELCRALTDRPYMRIYRMMS